MKIFVEWNAVIFSRVPAIKIWRSFVILTRLLLHFLYMNKNCLASIVQKQTFKFCFIVWRMFYESINTKVVKLPSMLAVEWCLMSKCLSFVSGRSLIQRRCVQISLKTLLSKLNSWTKNKQKKVEWTRASGSVSKDID